MQGEGSVQSQSQGTETGGLINLHPAFTDIGKVLNEYNDALGDIQLSGVSHVVDLPELVLVGDQSSGKSTLMSALALLESVLDKVVISLNTPRSLTPIL